MKIIPCNWWTTTTNLDEELKTLKNKVDHLKALESDNLTAADNEVIQPGKKRKREFEFWLKYVESKKSEYLQIENELREQGPSKNLKSCIEKEIIEVEELLEQGKFPNGIVLDDHASRRLPLVTTSLVGQSCAENVATILELLKEDGVFAIGVHGMGGVGKTTVVKEIHDRLLLDSDIAEQVHWVTASQDCSLEKLQNDIGKAIGLPDFSKEDNERKKAMLYQRISQLQNSVLIIDDLWDSYVMERIGIPLESKGCKVVITTRKLEVCRRMPCKHIIRIMPLNKEDSWTLFVEKLEELPCDVEHIAREIVQECAGLPLALITVGCCMRGITEVCEWENARYELRKPARRQDELEDEVFRTLRFSFDRLKDHKVQSCFLSCVLYPEDYVFTDVELVDLWNSEGLLDDMENHQDRVNKGHVILNRLMNACLLESSGDDLDRHIWMHDLIRDMGIIITKEHPLFIAEAGKQLGQVPEEEKWSKDLVKVSLGYNQIEKIPRVMAPRTPNLTVLMLNRNPLPKIPRSFFVNMIALRHLDLSSTNIERVPKSVSDLENLRGFLLVNCQGLRYVPSVAKLTKLRILDLFGCLQVKETPRGLERLKSLEKLSYIPWDVSELIGFNKVVQRCTSLSFFRFLIQDPKLCMLHDFDWNSFYRYDNLMWIRWGEYGWDKRSILVPGTLEYLVIERSDIKGTSLGDVFQSVGEATGLKRIDIKDCRGLENVFDSSGTQQGCSLLSITTKLENLWLHRLPDIRSIVKLRMPQSFSQLQVLCLSDCPRLKVIFPFTDELHLPNLKSVNISSCEELEEIFGSNKATPSNFLFVPKIEWLTLKDLPKLKVVFPFPFTEELHLPNLRYFLLESCKELEEIFQTNKATPSSNLILSLPKLRELTLNHLSKVKVIFPFTKELHLPSLESIDVEYCNAVEEIFQTNKATATVTATPSSKSNPTLWLPRLERLWLHDLPELRYIYGSLLSCTSLYNHAQFISDCPKLK